MDWKRLVEFALRVAVIWNNMPSCWYAFRSGYSSPSPGQTNCLSSAARKRFTKPSLRPKSPFPRQMAYFVSREVGGPLNRKREQELCDHDHIPIQWACGFRPQSRAVARIEGIAGMSLHILAYKPTAPTGPPVAISRAC
jgi:hypothetical protein